MDFLLAQTITETVEVQTKPEEPTGGSVKEEITIPAPSSAPLIRELDTYSRPLMPVPRLPMGTMTESITIPAPRLPLGTIPNIPEAKVSTPTSNTETEFSPGKIISEIVETKKNPDGSITYIKTICDGEVKIGPFQSCLKEFTGVPAVGWIAAATGLIVLWKWLDYKFRK